MRQFLVLFDDFPIDEQSVKAGANKQEVVTACRCVNVGLFVSGGLRRDVAVLIAVRPIDDLMVVSFQGDIIKRVSPDERSISFFLFKALAIAKRLPQCSQHVMDNGIIVKREGLKQIISSYTQGKVFVACRTCDYYSDSLGDMRDMLVIYDVGTCIDPDVSGLWKTDHRTVPYPLHPERLILDINGQSDDNENVT